ncbi:hypothetical protein GCM10009413_04360 [Tatumella punctata]|uniref:hypothetical protein n=1 Tax=Tatumella punctata TaxID=399969 RepID=UPI0033888E4A
MPRLADKGIYLASESTFYRVLRRSGEVHCRGRQARQQKAAVPTTYTATGPCQVWSWDITWLPSVVRGEDHVLLKQRDELYRSARQAHPERWSGKTRNWQPEGCGNPESGTGKTGGLN